MRANKDLLFSCFIDDPKGATALQNSVKGGLGIFSQSKLVCSIHNAGHAYAVLKTVEFRGKRFVKIRFDIYTDVSDYQN